MSQQGKLNSDALQETVLRWKSFGIPECDVEVHATDSGQFLPPTLLGTESALLVRVFLGQWKWENCIYNWWLLVVIRVILCVFWTFRSHQDMEVFIVFCPYVVSLECCFLCWSTMKDAPLRGGPQPLNVMLREFDYGLCWLTWPCFIIAVKTCRITWKRFCAFGPWWHLARSDIPGHKWRNKGKDLEITAA